MCRVLETIRYENGRCQNLNYHRQRMNYTRKVLFGLGNEIALEKAVQQAGKEQLILGNDGLFKCRVVYDSKIRDIRFLSYVLPQIRSLQLVKSDSIDYPFKYEDRSPLNRLFTLRGTADDILIVKNGLVTDTSFCNVLFFNGKQWLTPEQPLLRGTRRAALLEKEQIETAVIGVDDLHYFTKVRLINAMIRFEDQLDIPMEKVNRIFFNS
ncbi:Aminodeoxychorismate lyase [hydrothermal vent metagenome]|uniref:Aminodeoxychorismate lyase n=1 Tax=hydrothermal vent metagenome TaxID=652676 RepID=A0A3B0VF31_9ZZZZ